MGKEKEGRPDIVKRLTSIKKGGYKPKPKLEPGSIRPKPTPKPPTPGFLTIPSFKELWADIERKSLELGVKKEDLEVAELCSLGIYNKMMKIIREQLK